MKLKSLFGTVIFMTTLCLQTAAQSFFELSYTDPNDKSDEYVGLMIYYDDSNCHLRIINKELLEQDAVMKSDYTNVVEGKESSDDIGVSYFQPEDEDMPYLIWSWTKDDGSDISEVPQISFDIEKPQTWFNAESFQEIAIADMDEEYIAQFYGTGEPEYKMMMQGLKLVQEQNNSGKTQPTITPTNNTSNKGTLRLLVTANTTVSDIGQACKTDLQLVQNEFKGIAQALGLNYKETVVSGENYGKAQLVEAMNSIQPASDDIVVFFYTGHGFRFDDQKDYYPMLDLRSTSYQQISENTYIDLTSVYNTLKDKGERLCIVLSDCCNSKVGMNRPTVTSNSLLSRSNDNYDLNKLKALFLEQKGTLIATAASPGEYSWCTANGGFFLLSVIESLRSEISAFGGSATPSWTSVIDNAIKAAASKSQSNSQCQKQNGIKYVQVKSVKQ